MSRLLKILLGIAAAFNVACNQGASGGSIEENVAAKTEIVKVLMPLADGFDFPVGKPDGKGYYDAQPFRRNDHLGEDWNGRDGGNSDKGDPVYACATGRVKVSEDFGGGWGNVVRILHRFVEKEDTFFIESLYAHLDTVFIESGKEVERGQQIGTIGDAHGAYWAHLHFEMRSDTGLELGGGYSSDTTGFINPKRFILSHRPKH